MSLPQWEQKEKGSSTPGTPSSTAFFTPFTNFLIAEGTVIQFYGSDTETPAVFQLASNTFF